MAFFLRRFWNRITPPEQIAAYIRIVASEDGMTMIHDLANRYHLLTPHDGGEREEGQRSVVLHILKCANFTDDDFIRLTEHEQIEET